MISRLIHTLKNLLSYGGAWADGSEWTPEDALRLKGYLLTESGQRFAAKLRNTSIGINHTAVQSGKEHGCGFAAGYQAALADMQTLSETGSPQEAQASEEGADTGGSSLEHLIP